MMEVKKVFLNKVHLLPLKLLGQCEEKYKKDLGKLKSLELTLRQNDIIFIPAYWWYSIKYGENANICSFSYRTYMNTVAILPSLTISVLQSLNTKHNIVESVE